MPSDSDDQRELDHLINAYAIAVDALDHVALLACFLPNGRLRSGTVTFAGSDGLPGILDTVADADARFHQLGTRLFTIEPERALGTVYCVAHAVRTRADTTVLQTFTLRYHDEYRRGVDGHFRIADRELITLWSEERTAALARPQT